MGNSLTKTKIKELKEARYFSLIPHQTAHIDQLAVVLRYRPQNEFTPVERLIQLLPGILHKTSSLEDAVLECLENSDLKL